MIQDLQPYTCTSYECNEGDNKPLNSWEEWLVHEQVYHRMEYTCPYHPDQTFSSRENYVNHISMFHSEQKTRLLKPEVVDDCSQLAPKPTKACPLCLYKADNWPDMDKHLAFHLETLALLSLPLSTGLEKDDESMASLQLEGEDYDGIHLLDNNVLGPIADLFDSETESVNRNEPQSPQGIKQNMTGIEGLQQIFKQKPISEEDLDDFEITDMTKVNSKDKFGRSLLSYAAQYGNATNVTVYHGLITYLGNYMATISIQINSIGNTDTYSINMVTGAMTKL